jgi:hypothetical protein
MTSSRFDWVLKSHPESESESGPESELAKQEISAASANGVEMDKRSSGNRNDIPP